MDHSLFLGITNKDNSYNYNGNWIHNINGVASHGQIIHQ